MRIMATSDLHGNREGLDPKGADVVVLAGDIAPLATDGLRAFRLVGADRGHHREVPAIRFLRPYPHRT